MTVDFQQGNSLPGSDWSQRMYLETIAESFEVCRAMCYFHDIVPCKLFAYDNPKCYFGDPLGEYSTVSSDATLYIQGDYGKST